VILALETSCDDTCAAVLSASGEILANVISSQGVHDRYGGVVPEVASRQHVTLVNLVIDEALREASVTLDDLGLVAVTRGPGLIGALLVGIATAKGLAAARELPLAGVDHLQGHVAASFLGAQPLDPPFLCLVASGGHTFLARVGDRSGYEVLGRTLDDAAGEAFDKGARMLGLPYPGGPALDRLASGGDDHAFDFPAPGGGADRGRPFAAGLDFSFAGLKTALRYRVAELGATETERRRADLAASYQRAIVDALVLRVEAALARSGLDRLAVGGGVAANRLLRSRLSDLSVPVAIPPPELCTDNAAMIASAARFMEALPYPDYLSLDAYATGSGPSALVRGRR